MTAISGRRSTSRSTAPSAPISNVLAFDRTGEQLLPIATIIRETTPEHQTALIKHIVERVTVTDGQVTGIELRPEARPFYAGSVMAPPDGLEPPTRTLGECRSIH